MLEVCRRNGWTYHDFMANPHWVNELAIEQLVIDTKKAKAAQSALQ